VGSSRHTPEMEGRLSLPRPTFRLHSWTSASDLTAVTETESTASVVIVAAMTTRAIVAVTISATIEAEPVVT
jgi:uncharacterized protein YbbK (DUF523 family)